MYCEQLSEASYGCYVSKKDVHNVIFDHRTTDVLDRESCRLGFHVTPDAYAVTAYAVTAVDHIRSAGTTQREPCPIMDKAALIVRRLWPILPAVAWRCLLYIPCFCLPCNILPLCSSVDVLYSFTFVIVTVHDVIRSEGSGRVASCNSARE